MKTKKKFKIRVAKSSPKKVASRRIVYKKQTKGRKKLVLFKFF